ncbi:MAG: ATP-binding protein [Thermotogota bacterium]|nr:ATP-binding protein [Thermotogota bacterium]
MKTKQVAIISGKGGTGKTTLAGSLSVLFDNHVIADCDVDSSNMHLILKPKINETIQYKAGHKAEIVENKCIGCGKCQEVCRYNAISKKNNGKYTVDPFACEGCKACVLVCPTKAVDFVLNHPGDYYTSDTKYGPFVHAELKPGEEMSGGLVAQVRKRALKMAVDGRKATVIIDGAPGIGCPATSSLTGTDYAVLVTEPTVSGIHDMERMMEVIKHFKIPFSVVINRFDINDLKTLEIEKFCLSKNIPIIGKIPFDRKVNIANSNEYPIVEIKNSKATKSIQAIYKKLKAQIDQI